MLPFLAAETKETEMKWISLLVAALLLAGCTAAGRCVAGHYIISYPKGWCAEQDNGQ